MFGVKGQTPEAAHRAREPQARPRLGRSVGRGTRAESSMRTVWQWVPSTDRADGIRRPWPGGAANQRVASPASATRLGPCPLAAVPSASRARPAQSGARPRRSPSDEPPTRARSPVAAALPRGAQLGGREQRRLLPVRVTGRLETGVERHAGRSRGLDERLGIIEIEAATERQPAGGQGEGSTGPEVSRVNVAARSAHGTRAGKRSGHTSGSRSSRARSSACSRRAASSWRCPSRGERCAGDGNELGVTERALDALGGQIRQRAGQVKEERRAGRVQRGPAAAADEAVARRRVEVDQISHCLPATTRPGENWRKNRSRPATFVMLKLGRWAPSKR